MGAPRTNAAGIGAGLLAGHGGGMVGSIVVGAAPPDSSFPAIFITGTYVADPYPRMATGPTPTDAWGDQVEGLIRMAYPLPTTSKAAGM